MASLKSIISRTGQLGSLTPAQDAALTELKQKLALNGYLPAAEHVDDGTVLRFLRARKFDVAGAYTQFTETADWRREDDIETLYNEFSVEEFNQTQLVYPQWTGRVDRSGLPLYLFKISNLTKEAVASYSKDSDRLVNRMIALYEHMVNFALPFAGSVAGLSINATVTIVDVSDVSLSQFWALRSHMQAASVLASAKYAETLGRIYIVGAPSVFPIVWKWIGKWFDPGTVDKIYILSDKDRFEVLSRFIEPENIPEDYGGSLPFKFTRDRPILDSESIATLGMDYLMQGPLRWSDEAGLIIEGSGRSEADLEAYSKRRPWISTSDALAKGMEATKI